MASTNRKPQEDELASLIASAARKALKEGGGDPKMATDILEAAVRRDQRLRDAIVNPMIRQACYVAVGAEIRKDRSEVWNAQPRERMERVGQSQVHRVVQLAAGTLLMFPLPGGVKLGEATREQVAEGAEFYERQAGDMAHKARWLKLVGQSVPQGRTVGEVLDDKRLRELQEAARDEH